MVRRLRPKLNDLTDIAIMIGVAIGALALAVLVQIAPFMILIWFVWFLFFRGH